MATTVTPADRLSAVQEYYFSRKLKEIARLNAEGKDIISLAIGSPDMPPSDQTIDRLCSVARDADAHGYQPTMGTPELREAMALFYKRWYGVELRASDEILPLIGSKEGILHTTFAFVNPGDGVLVPNPGYPTYTSVSRLADARIFQYDLTEENGWEPDFDALEQLPLEQIKLMWTNYPNMPTGRRASIDLFKKLVEFGRKHNIVIVNDNPYSFILNDNPLSILNIEGAKDIAIEMNSLSKSHNMAGWRIAMVASNQQFIQWILRVKSNVDSGQFRPMMLAAAKALQCDQSWYDQVNATYKQRRAIAEQIMQALGCTFDPTQAGLFLWGKIPADATDAETLSEKILHKARVFITPGHIFGSNGNRYLRISLCCADNRMQQALDRIKNMNN